MLINEIEETDISYWTKVISQKCKHALSEMKSADGFLYHGSGWHDWHDESDHTIQRMKDDYFISVTKIRRPAFPYPNAEQKLEQMGFKALRSNSLFCNGKLSNAEGYGNPYMIFPCDGYNITWSSKNTDYFSKDDWRYEGIDPAEFVQIEEMKNNDLAGAIRSGHAIYIVARFISIRYTYDNQKFIKDRVF